jgi:hypothetical protein
MQVSLRRLCRAGDHLTGLGSVIADELLGAIYHHLRGVDALQLEVAAICILTFCVLMRGEAIVPALAVPIVYVLAQNDNFGSGYRLLLLQLQE